MKEPLPTIPRPAAERWRDLRLRQIPILIYVTGILLVIYLWNTQWMPSSFTGEVQAAMANVASPLAGSLADVSVRQFDHVARGQVLGRVIVAPEAVLANLAAIRADLQVTRARMIVDGQRRNLDYERVRVDQLDQKVQLAVAVSKLRFAESELARAQSMHSDRIVSQSEYELALDTRDALATEVKERQELVAEMDKSLLPLKPAGPADGNLLILDTIDAAIRAEEERFQRSGETVLRAPIDGIVTRIFRSDGENITAGEPLIAISSERPESIIGFVRQPISFEPRIGDRVLVRTRRSHRQAGEARIVKLGARLEFFTQPLRVRGFDSSQERGLPVLIDLPRGITLHPGELVDLALKTDKQQTTAPSLATPD